MALAYLTHEKFQAELLSTGNFELLQQAFYNSYTQFDIAASDPEEAAQLRQIWGVFVQVFADISALPTFSTNYPPGSQAVQRLVTWLDSPSSYAHLRIAACLSLGNLPLR